MTKEQLTVKMMKQMLANQYVIMTQLAVQMGNSTYEEKSEMHDHLSRMACETRNLLQDAKNLK